MTKEQAVFARQSSRDVLAALGRLGYWIRNPESGEIRAWDAAGDLRLLRSEEAANAFLTEGTGLQLWKNATEDAFVSVVGGAVRLSFDGFTQDEQANLVFRLSSIGCTFEVLREDE